MKSFCLKNIFFYCFFFPFVISAQLLGGQIKSNKAFKSLPENITLSSIKPYFIASVYDLDYIPYVTPIVAASLSTGVADGVLEPKTIDIQGTLTTTGVTINIPYTVVTAPVTLPNFSQTITIPASYTEDGVSREVTFSYSAITLPVSTGNIVATLKSTLGTLNVKKLDIQTGIGNDVLGFLLAEFIYGTNNTGGSSTFQVRAISGIPDREFSEANHKMLYLPVTDVNGVTWLNNNLGADYSNIDKASFNLAKQAIDATDFRAYGSLYQWGRYSDGHELINWTSAIGGTVVNNITETLSSDDIPDNSLFILGTNAPFDWRNPQNNGLWQGGSGVNNPCPEGFKVPTYDELISLVTVSNINNIVTAANSFLKLTAAGRRLGTNGDLSFVTTLGNYWSSTSVAGTTISALVLTQNDASRVESTRTGGRPVRCISN